MWIANTNTNTDSDPGTTIPLFLFLELSQLMRAAQEWWSYIRSQVYRYLMRLSTKTNTIYVREKCAKGMELQVFKGRMAV
jgi:hypothetical protein